MFLKSAKKSKITKREENTLVLEMMHTRWLKKRKEKIRKEKKKKKKIMHPRVHVPWRSTWKSALEKYLEK